MAADSDDVDALSIHSCVPQVLDPTQEFSCEGLWQRSSVFLGGKTWERGTRQTAGKREDLVEERARGFNLDVMRGASAVFGLLVELPCPFRWQGFARQAFASCRIRFWSRSSRTLKNISSPASQNTLTAYLRT